MIDEIQGIIRFVEGRKRRIDEAVNNIPTNTEAFLDCEHAISELATAIKYLKSAQKHITSSRSDKIIWRLDA